MTDTTTIRLTQFAQGAGCGCKIAPKILEEILDQQWTEPNEKLLVGNNSNDDAAVYDAGNGEALISTTDFFTPVVNDAFTFGQIAAANAISDVYAMGGKPLLALAILGWPTEKIAPAIARQVIEGARSICKTAGISLAGGHSITNSEPVFGLAVTGTAPITNIKRNNTAQPGDFIFLTKPIGVGILTTAEKKEKLLEEHISLAAKQMIQLNTIGYQLGACTGVTAMTDVTGFGLAGHLIEMLSDNDLSAELVWNSIPVITNLSHYLKNRIVPDATYRNWNAYGNAIRFEKGVPVSDAFSILPDPQTNGGLLFTVKPEAIEAAQYILQQNGLEQFIHPIGNMIVKEESLIRVL
jgi:selenide,water dikinase